MAAEQLLTLGPAAISVANIDGSVGGGDSKRGQPDIALRGTLLRQSQSLSQLTDALAGRSQ